MNFQGIVCLLGLLVAHSGFAAESVEIVKSEGGVTLSQAAVDKTKASSTQVLSTGANGRAVVRVGNTGYVVLEKNSQVEISSANDHSGFFRHLTGMIYYAVHAIKGNERPVEVRTKTATIGIRGTRFIVADTDERNEIGMRKGTISVTSLKEDFEVHKKSEQDELEAMKQEAQAAMNKEKSDFGAYKESVKREFVEYKRELTLGADRMLSFDGRRVDDRPLSGATKKELESLESYAGEWINKVQD
jgi:hypothetical protein